MRKTLFVVGALLAAAGVASMSARTQQVTKQDVDGVKNFKRLETTVACAGATKADAVPEIKKMGFASIINLREASEEGANVEAEEAAAKNVGMRYYHIPFNGSNPDPAVAEKFLNAITASGSDPVDHWDVDRATKEATELGMTSDKLKQFAIDFAQSHKR